MAPAGIDGGDEAVHKASRPKSSSQVTLCWRKMIRTPHGQARPWVPRQQRSSGRGEPHSYATLYRSSHDSSLEGAVRCELVSAAGPDSGPD